MRPYQLRFSHLPDEPPLRFRTQVLCWRRELLKLVGILENILVSEVVSSAELLPSIIDAAL
jgi:hypothetical protein